MKPRTLQLQGLALISALTASLLAAGQDADVIYLSGNIITLHDDQPNAQAVAIADGIILAVGDEADVMRTRDDTTLIVDLDGRTMLPGFVDSHGHAYMVGLQASVANLLPPPDAEVDSIDVLVATLARWAEQNQYAVERVGWIIGFGYDNAQLAEHRHPTRDDLDLVSVDVPVIVVHQSGHVGSANSKALEVAGITAETEDPPGGRFERRDGSNEPNGFAEEYAFFALIGRAAQNFDDKVNDVFVERGASLLASYGYTTAQEGRAIGLSLEAMKRVADAGKLPIDLVAYPDILEVEDIKPSMTYTGRYRVGGVKLTIDGSPQGKTAWLSQPYHVPPPGMPPEYVGYPAITPEQTHGAFEKAYANGWQIITHANGDAAIDALIGAVKLAHRNHPEVDNRPVLIYGQTLRHDQVAQLDALGVFPSLFPMHTFYWGDFHRDSVLGPERAENISPTGWLRDRGMMFGSHHDAPVALPDSMRVLSATVTRRSRSGDILGPRQRVSVMDGLRSLTIWPAWQHFEEQRKGSIEVGKIADFVILSDNPLTVPEDRLDDLYVMETIKDGETIYTRDESAGARLRPPPLGLHAHAQVTAADPFQVRLRAYGRLIGCDGCINPAVHVMLRSMPDKGRQNATDP